MTKNQPTLLTNNTKRFPVWSAYLLLVLAPIISFLLIASPSYAAINKIPDPDPQPGSYGLEATKKQPPPASAPSISTPGDGASFSSSPITVSGVCKQGLLVEISDNGVFVGSVICSDNSFSIKVSLFTGKNDIKAIQYDELNQASPASNRISVTYNGANFSSVDGVDIGKFITLTSNYSRREADPGDTLSWPLQLSGGTGPYAFSIDWGDNKSATLKSVPLAGNVTIDHVYSRSGIYNVTIRVTDKNGVSAFLQVVAVSKGKPVAADTTKNKDKAGSDTVVTKVLWVPVLIILLLLIPAFWLGRRSELVSIRKKLEQDMEKYKES